MNIRPKDRDALIQALRAGVVPNVGQHLIQVGRSNEIESLLKDLERVAVGGTAFRLIIGEYGSGKTFFLNLIRSIGLEKKLVATSADLNPDRRLHGSGGQARSLYAELAKNLSTKSKPEGGALAGIVEKFIYTAEGDARTRNVGVDVAIHEKLERLSEMVNGYDFAHVIETYWKASRDNNQDLKANAIRWLRGEYTTKTDARNALGVRTFVDDASFYDQLKLMSLFVRLSGFTGLLVCLDEMVNLYKLSSRQARESNYEQILRMLNDTLQGNVEGLGFLLGGTPEFLNDTRRGLFSYSALQSRLAENMFAKSAGVIDFNHPVLKLSSLTPEDFFVLLGKIQTVYVYGDEARSLIPEDGQKGFMDHCYQRIGEAYFRTPRTTITSWVNLLSVIEQNPSLDWQQLTGQIEVKKDMGGSADLEVADVDPGMLGTSGIGDDEFTGFKL
ncbi:MAG: ATP-binding protein [Terracidiphilus sp.]